MPMPNCPVGMRVRLVVQSLLEAIAHFHILMFIQESKTAIEGSNPRQVSYFNSSLPLMLLD